MRIALVVVAGCASSVVQTGAVPDAARAADGAVPATDAGVLATCGNGALDPGEVCDGTPRACAELGASFASGMADCRADCRGWSPQSCAVANPGQFEAVKPAQRDGKWADARCNDGSPFAFVVRLAQPASNDWVIYLEGGVYCDDYSFACASRDAYLTSTLAFGDRSMGPIPITGIVGSNAAANPDFAHANQVLAHYCSSDFWSGATTTAHATTGGSWYFSGHVMVDAMIGILAERYGLDDEAPIRVLFGGGSAGAFGAHFNAARVAAALPDATAAGRLKLLVDAGWMTEWDDPAHRLGSATTSDRDVWTRARGFWGATFDPACEAAHADPVDCWFGPSWYPHMVMPTLIQQCSIDQSFTMVHNLSPGDVAASTWHAQVSASLSPVTWLFSGTQSYHMLAPDDSTITYHGFSQTLHAFWTGSAPQRVVF